MLVGPGFDDADATRATLLTIAQSDIRCLILDAFALGVLPDVDRHLLPADLILNPNEEEAAILLGREPAASARMTFSRSPVASMRSSTATASWPTRRATPGGFRRAAQDWGRRAAATSWRVRSPASPREA